MFLWDGVGVSVPSPMFLRVGSLPLAPSSFQAVSVSGAMFLPGGLSDRDLLDRDPLDRDPSQDKDAPLYRDPLLDVDPPAQRPPDRDPRTDTPGQSGRNASYWNAFLFEFRFPFYWFVVMSLVSVSVWSFFILCLAMGTFFSIYAMCFRWYYTKNSGNWQDWFW